MLSRSEIEVRILIELRAMAGNFGNDSSYFWLAGRMADILAKLSEIESTEASPVAEELQEIIKDLMQLPVEFARWEYPRGQPKKKGR